MAKTHQPIWNYFSIDGQCLIYNGKPALFYSNLIQSDGGTHIRICFNQKSTRPTITRFSVSNHVAKTRSHRPCSWDGTHILPTQLVPIPAIFFLLYSLTVSTSRGTRRTILLLAKENSQFRIICRNILIETRHATIETKVRTLVNKVSKMIHQWIN